MTNLRVFGGLWLENEHTVSAGRGGQRRRLALLAVLCLSPERRLTRDKVLSILWPEASALEGRRRLSTAVYDIRKSLGDDIVVSNGDELWIPPECSLTCDVDCFEDAVAQAHWEKAVASYHGALIDGVHLSDAPEFDEWVSLHRERLRRLYVHAVEQVLALRNSAGNHASAVAAAHLLLDIEPLSERIALLAAVAIAANGAPAEAVRSLEQYGVRVRTELGTQPNPRVRDLATSFRTVSETLAHSLAPAPHKQKGTGKSLASSVPSTAKLEPIAHDSVSNTPSPLVAHRQPIQNSVHPWKHNARVTAIVAIVALVVGTLASRAPPPNRTSGGVMVEPFSITGDSIAPRLRTLIAGQLQNTLNESGAFDADESSAQANGTHQPHVVTGQVVGRMHRLHISAMLRDGSAGAQVSAAENDVSADSVETAVNALARKLIAGALEGASHHLAAVAARTAASIPALSAFVTGDRQYRHGHFAAAQSSFETAIASDSAFALAHYRLSETLLWEDKPAGLAALHDSLANIYSATLPMEERTMLSAYIAWRTGDAVRAESLYRAIVARNPRNSEAWYQLGETLFHYNPLRGRPAYDAYEVFNWALALDSTDWGTGWHMALLDAGRLSQTVVRARMNVLLHGHAEGFVAHEIQLFAADGNNGELAARADSSSATVLYDAAWRRAIYRHDLAGAEMLLLAMTRGNRPVAEQRKGAYLAGGLRLAGGRVRDALALLTVAHPTLDDNEALIMLVHATLSESLHTGVANSDSLQIAIDRWRQANSVFAPRSQFLDVTASYLHGLLAVERGDVKAAARDARALGSMKSVWRDPRTLAEAIRSFQEFRNGNCGATLAHLDRTSSSIWLGYVASAAIASQGFERFLRAECLQKLGRQREAIAWYASLEQNTLYDLAFLGLALRGEAISFRAIGDTLAAVAVETRLTALRTKADKYE